MWVSQFNYMDPPLKVEEEAKVLVRVMWWWQGTEGVPWWLSGLKMQHCHCCGSGQFCGAGSIPGPGTSACCRCGQKKKKKKKRERERKEKKKKRKRRKKKKRKKKKKERRESPHHHRLSKWRKEGHEPTIRKWKSVLQVQETEFCQ